jgi:hypothetical protein
MEPALGAHGVERSLHLDAVARLPVEIALHLGQLMIAENLVEIGFFEIAQLQALGNDRQVRSHSRRVLHFPSHG